ncbi:MAG: AAA family ATPase [Thermoproteota archaeon]|jgi:predicted kinase
MLIVMCGLPATGKTTVAEALAKVIKAVILRTDLIRREIFKEGKLEEVLNSREPLIYDLQRVFDPLPKIPEEYQKLIWKQNEIVYEELLRRTENLLRQGENVILDGTFSKKALRNKVYDVAKAYHANVYLVYCTCDEKIIEQRLSRREKEKERLSNVTKMDVYYKVKANFEEPSRDGVPIVHYDSGKDEVEIWNKNLGDEKEIKLIINVVMNRL